MCEHCGCRGVEPIAELMDEHLALLDLGGSVRRALSGGDRRTAVGHLTVLARHLDRHVRRARAQGDHGDREDAERPGVDGLG
jgi:hypothetical protein